MEYKLLDVKGIVIGGLKLKHLFLMKTWNNVTLTK
jgi:hypothetical protein